MTVEELIKELKKHPPKARVGWQDHDASEGELSAHVRYVSPFKPDGTQAEDWTRNVAVVIRN